MVCISIYTTKNYLKFTTLHKLKFKPIVGRRLNKAYTKLICNCKIKSIKIAPSVCPKLFGTAHDIWVVVFELSTFVHFVCASHNVPCMITLDIFLLSVSPLEVCIGIWNRNMKQIQSVNLPTPPSLGHSALTFQAGTAKALQSRKNISLCGPIFSGNFFEKARSKLQVSTGTQLPYILVLYLLWLQLVSASTTFVYAQQW